MTNQNVAHQCLACLPMTAWYTERYIAYCLKIELCLLTSRLCLLYKILHIIVDVTLPSCITPLTRLTRGHDQKFILPQSRIDAYKYNFFPNSIRL